MLNGIDRQAILSMTPFTGPFVGVYNVTMAKTQVLFNETMSSVSQDVASQGARENIADVRINAEATIAELAEEEPALLEKEILYSKTALVGNLINLIGAIMLIATNILTGPLSILVLGSLVIGSAVYSYNLYGRCSC